MHRWLERLSLDAVAVAVVWALALGQMGGMDLVILAMATWLTYVADRLWEVRPGKMGPATDRHQFHRRQYQRIRWIWGVTFCLAVILAIIDLPLWKWAGGWCFVGGIVVYLSLLGRNWGETGRLMLKRIVVPLIFTGGVGWMAESWRQPESIVATGLLLCGALVNVIQVTLWEQTERELPKPLKWLHGCGLAGLAGLSFFGMMRDPALAVSALTALFGFSLLQFQIKRRYPGNLRLVADLVLLVSGVVYLVAQG